MEDPKAQTKVETAVSVNGISLEDIRREAEENFDDATQTDDGDNVPNLFKFQTANRWLDEAKTRPVPKMLFGEFWFEGEICILFADTNVGKSILAVQAGDAISKGIDIGPLTIEAPAQKVVYFDFELTDKQFEARYSEKIGLDEFFSNHFRFDDNFIRAEIDPDADIDHPFHSFEDYLNNSIKYVIAETGSRILIVDNLTYLKHETERAKDALPLMKHLKALKSRFGLSILALAHTPKRDHSKELGRNDLQGSKMLINFCDSSFAIGESAKEQGLRYLRQIKTRNAAEKYGKDNVMLCEITKKDPDNFLHMEMVGFGRESEHLKVITESDRKELVARVKSLSNAGASQRAIARELGIAVGTVNKYLQQ